MVTRIEDTESAATKIAAMRRGKAARKEAQERRLQKEQPPQEPASAPAGAAPDVVLYTGAAERAAGIKASGGKSSAKKPTAPPGELVPGTYLGASDVKVLSGTQYRGHPTTLRPQSGHPTTPSQGGVTSSMARAQRQFDAHVEEGTPSHTPSFVSTWGGPPPPITPGMLQQSAEMPKPVMLSTRGRKPASGRPATARPRMMGSLKVAKDAGYFYPAPPSQVPHPATQLSPRKPPTLHTPAAPSSMDVSMLLSQKGVLTSPRPRAKPSRRPKTAKAEPDPGRSSVREQVRWPEKPARRVSSRTHGPHVLPTPLDASAATTTYFLINASYGQGQFRSGVVR